MCVSHDVSPSPVLEWPFLDEEHTCCDPRGQCEALTSNDLATVGAFRTTQGSMTSCGLDLVSMQLITAFVAVWPNETPFWKSNEWRQRRVCGLFEAN